MDKSRSGQHKEVKSYLNIFRELCLAIASGILWIYCMTVLIVLIGTLFNFNSYVVLLIRSILNIESSELIFLFHIAFIFTIITVSFCVLSLIVQTWKGKRDDKKYN